jgi:Bacterial SH3 domain
MSRRHWALVAVLVLVNYIIFSSLATVVLNHRDRMPPPTRTPLPTFTSRPSSTPVALVPTVTPSATSTPTRVQQPTPTATATSVVSQPTEIPAGRSSPESAERPSLTVKTSLRVRAGPGTNYPQIGSLSPDTTVAITGRNADASWWQISYAKGPGGKGWISASPSYSTAQNTQNVPIVEAPAVPTTLPTPVAPAKPKWQFEPTGFEGQWNAGLAQIRGKVVDTAGQPVSGAFMQARCGGTTLASNPSGINLYAPENSYEPGAFDIILSSPISRDSMCKWEVRVVQANNFEEAKDPGAPALSDTAYCELEWEIASICFTRWRKNW